MKKRIGKNKKNIIHVGNPFILYLVVPFQLIKKENKGELNQMVDEEMNKVRNKGNLFTVGKVKSEIYGVGAYQKVFVPIQMFKIKE